MRIKKIGNMTDVADFLTESESITLSDSKQGQLRLG